MCELHGMKDQIDLHQTNGLFTSHIFSLFTAVIMLIKFNETECIASSDGPNIILKRVIFFKVLFSLFKIVFESIFF
jgi:hypothetical protein